VSLPDPVTADDVRVELYDAAGPPPAVCADDAALRHVRRATLFLAGWRALLADVRIWGVAATPAARLRTVIRTLAPDTDGPLWSGGPALSHLRRIAELGDSTLAALLRTDAPVPATSIAGDDGGATARRGAGGGVRARHPGVVALAKSPGGTFGPVYAGIRSRSSRGREGRRAGR
jgi:hypothetical protein